MRRFVARSEVTRIESRRKNAMYRSNRWIVVVDPTVKAALVDQAGVPRRVREAPISIVQVLRMGWNHNKLSAAQAMGMAAQNLLLAATALGLQSVIQAGIGDTDAIRRILHIDEGYFGLADQ